MKVVYAGLLLTGLILLGASIYESGTRGQTSTLSAMEDGSPMPSPNGTPPPKPSK